MQDFEIARLTVIGTVIVAVIAAVAAVVAAVATAGINAWNTQRVDRVKVIRDAKLKDARAFRRALNKRTAYYLELRAGRRPPPPSDPSFSPIFMSHDHHIAGLIDLVNKYRKDIEQALKDEPNELSVATQRQIDEAARVIILLHHLAEISMLSDITPATHVEDLRETASEVMEGIFNFEGMRPKPRSKARRGRA